jgi:ribosome maturation factor RimP
VTSRQHSGPDHHSGQGLASAKGADALRQRIEDALSGPLHTFGLDVEAVEITPAGKRRVLRVAVDADRGPTLDDIAIATRRVSEILDASDVMGELPYTLEVTSRGVDRPLTVPRHWRRNADRLVAVTLTDGTLVIGRVAGSDESGVDLVVDDEKRRVGYLEIATALIQIEFNRPPASPVENQECDL